MNDTRYAAIVAALREEFPKVNKGTVSMALNTHAYGVKFCARAQEIYDAVTQQKRHSQKRRKTFRMQCRLAESTAERVKQALERNGIASMQTFLESLVLARLAQIESAAGWDESDSASSRKNNRDYPTTEGVKMSSAE